MPESIHEKFTWTPEGRERISNAILATLSYNMKHRCKPSSVRELAELSGQNHHTSVQRYSAGKTSDPNRDNCRILKDIAPFIYRVESFEIELNSRKIK